MKRVLLSLLCTAVSMCGWSQIKHPQVRILENQGWSVQHSVMSWDSLSVYFSAKAPGERSYDLYIVQAEGYRWGPPQRIDALSTQEDEWWPSVSSDERMLIYVTRTPADPLDKTSFEKTHIWRAWNREGQWTEAAPIIVGGPEDGQPVLLEDNKTLLFLRREEEKKHNGAWMKQSVTMMDDHNWTLPNTYSIPPDADPILAVSGTIVAEKSGRPLADGRVLVYDALNETLCQQARVHPVTGQWRVALQRNRFYRIALTADGYSYHYFEFHTNDVKQREERSLGPVALDNELALTLNTYDAETQDILTEKKHILPLGQMHSLSLRQAGYDDTTLVVNTLRPTVFTQTELDIPMEPKKRMHHFAVTNLKTGAPIDEATLRLNGKVTSADTALRIGHEMALQVSAPGYLFYDTLIHSGKERGETTISIGLQPIEKDLVLQLRNIQFEYDSYELTESSNEALEALAQLLFINPTLHIELSAHTDDQGSDRYNDRLSSLRGKAVAEWLLRRGVESSRIESKGYGKHKPLVNNDSEEHRALNRRVEIKVTDF